MLSKAILIASEAFKDKKDKGGKPYILHCLFVMNQMPENDEELKIIAILHDLIEDCGDIWSIQKLREFGFSERTLSVIDLLTHKEGFSYRDYIKLISTNEDAKKVKLADLKHNSDITRIKELRKKDFERLEKYYFAYTYLSE